jgi:hypothetical protein
VGRVARPKIASRAETAIVIIIGIPIGRIAKEKVEFFGGRTTVQERNDDVGNVRVDLSLGDILIEHVVIDPMRKMIGEIGLRASVSVPEMDERLGKTLHIVRVTSRVGVARTRD